MSTGRRCGRRSIRPSTTAATPCWRRIQKLEAAGYIKQRVALLDRDKLRAGVEVINGFGKSAGLIQLAELGQIESLPLLSDVELPLSTVLWRLENVGIAVEDGLVDVTRYRPVSRLGYFDYATVTEVFQMFRPD